MPPKNLPLFLLCLLARPPSLRLTLSLLHWSLKTTLRLSRLKRISPATTLNQSEFKHISFVVVFLYLLCCLFGPYVGSQVIYFQLTVYKVKLPALLISKRKIEECKLNLDVFHIDNLENWNISCRFNVTKTCIDIELFFLKVNFMYDLREWFANFLCWRPLLDHKNILRSPLPFQTGLFHTL